MDAIMKRVSVRAFTNQEVEEEKIETLLRAAMQAPSAGNQQPWEFFVVKDRDVITSLAACSPYAKAAQSAPLVIVPVMRAKDNMRFPECAPLDMSAAVENILLAAQDLGLGAVWMGIAPVRERIEAVSDVLHLAEGVTAFALIPVGYPNKKSEAKDRFDDTRIHRI